MKTVRFSKVVEKAGRPEVYLLLSETDEPFQKALTAHRVMSLSGEGHGPESGTVGYDKSRRGQLLVFPKSLESFSDAKVVGIKYDLLADPPPEAAKPVPVPRKAHPISSKKPRIESKPVPPPKPKAKRLPSKKLIPFPREQVKETPKDITRLKAGIGKALKVLEKGNSVAAYKILKDLVTP